MDAQTVNQSFSIVEIVPGLKKAGAYHVGPCPLCGGRDRFTVKHTPGGDRWHCRNCSPSGYRTPIDFLMVRDGLDFKQALTAMGGEVQAVRPCPNPKPAPVQIELPSREWQSIAWQEIDNASDRLIELEEGQPGRRYLTGRGLHRGTMNAWLLGYSNGRIVIPWLDGDTVQAVKYRFIEAKDKGSRFAMRKGSRPYLFGLIHILPSDRTLLFVEGELNAISIWQCLPDGVSVVSAGSESNGNPALLRSLARRYDRVVIWADDRAREIQEKIGVIAQLIKSPQTMGRKWDASEMLANGLLADFLTGMLKVKCQGLQPEQATR